VGDAGKWGAVALKCVRRVGVRRVTVSLDPQTLALVRIAVATATGDETKLRDRMVAAQAVHVPPQWVDELLLQSFLNVGYPLALVAFGVWRSVAGRAGEREGRVHRASRVGAVDQTGREACAEVYGGRSQADAELTGAHPAVETVGGRGCILGRFWEAGLDSKRRELCTLAAIAMQNAPRQLHAHLRGALNTGSSRDEVMR